MSGRYAVGIDLGTTNSVVSIYRRGIAETLNVDGRNTVPSVVSLRDGQILVGQQAKARLLADPENSVGSVKRFMGDRQKSFLLGNKNYTPVDISALILKKVVDGASGVLGNRVTDAVITVPAYFNEDQKLETKQAGEKAGLNVLRIIPEPTSAAVAYGLDKGKDQVILVYDLGGGTFDVSILKVEGNRFTVMAVDGDAQLGGDDFDQILLQHLAELFKQRTGVDLYVPGKGVLAPFKQDISRESRIALQRLKEAAETAKIELSQTESTEVIMPDLFGYPFEARVTRDEYVKMTQPLLNRTIEKVRDLLKSARMTAADIDRVILVGGSTRNPTIRQLISQEIKDPYTSDRVDEIVSHGAAIMAANLFLPEEDRDKAPIEVTNVQAHSLGIDLQDSTGKIVFRPIIAKNTAYPCKSGVLGQTIEQYQSAVRMKVFRGESSAPEENHYLGELLLTISKPCEYKVPVAAVFELDDDGLLHFTAVEIFLKPETLPYLERAIGPDSIVLRDLDTLNELVEAGHAKSVKTEIKIQ